MSYGRDPDRFSRAPGAIAARDNAHPRKALARQALAARRTVALDRVRRTMTYGPRGGMSAMGAVNLGYQGGTTNAAHMTSPIRFDYGTGQQPPIPTGQRTPIPVPTSDGSTRTPNTATAVTGAARTQILDALLRPTATGVGFPSSSDPTGGGTRTPPPPTRTPPRAPLAPVSSGGGGTWIAPPKPAPLPPLEPTDLPDVPTGGRTGFDLKTAGLVGAAALAAYLIFGRKKKGTP